MFGALADRVGPKPIMITAFTLYLGLAYPLFSWVHESESRRIDQVFEEPRAGMEIKSMVVVIRLFLHCR